MKVSYTVEIPEGATSFEPPVLKLRFPGAVLGRDQITNTMKVTFVPRDKKPNEDNLVRQDSVSFFLDSSDDMGAVPAGELGKVVKSIDNPHFMKDETFFMDTPKERALDFVWHVAFGSMPQNTTATNLTFYDTGLDERMKYKAIRIDKRAFSTGGAPRVSFSEQATPDDPAASEKAPFTDLAATEVGGAYVFDIPANKQELVKQVRVVAPAGARIGAGNIVSLDVVTALKDPSVPYGESPNFSHENSAYATLTGPDGKLHRTRPSKAHIDAIPPTNVIAVTKDYWYAPFGSSVAGTKPSTKGPAYKKVFSEGDVAAYVIGVTSMLNETVVHHNFVLDDIMGLNLKLLDVRKPNGELWYEGQEDERGISYAIIPSYNNTGKMGVEFTSKKPLTLNAANEFSQSEIAIIRTTVRGHKSAVELGSNGVIFSSDEIASGRFQGSFSTLVPYVFQTTSKILVNQYVGNKEMDPVAWSADGATDAPGETMGYVAQLTNASNETLTDAEAILTFGAPGDSQKSAYSNKLLGPVTPAPGYDRFTITYTTDQSILQGTPNPSGVTWLPKDKVSDFSQVKAVRFQLKDQYVFAPGDVAKFGYDMQIPPANETINTSLGSMTMGAFLKDKRISDNEKKAYNTVFVKNSAGDSFRNRSQIFINARDIKYSIKASHFSSESTRTWRDDFDYIPGPEWPIAHGVLELQELKPGIAEKDADPADDSMWQPATVVAKPRMITDDLGMAQWDNVPRKMYRIVEVGHVTPYGPAYLTTIYPDNKYDDPSVTAFNFIDNAQQRGSDRRVVNVNVISPYEPYFVIVKKDGVDSLEHSRSLPGAVFRIEMLKPGITDTPDINDDSQWETIVSKNAENDPVNMAADQTTSDGKTYTGYFGPYVAGRLKDDKGLAFFKVPYGTYRLTEVKIPEGYEIPSGYDENGALKPASKRKPGDVVIRSLIFPSMFQDADSYSAKPELHEPFIPAPPPTPTPTPGPNPSPSSRMGIASTAREALQPKARFANQLASAVARHNATISTLMTGTDRVSVTKDATRYFYKVRFTNNRTFDIKVNKLFRKFKPFSVEVPPDPHDPLVPLNGVEFQIFQSTEDGSGWEPIGDGHGNPIQVTSDENKASVTWTGFSYPPTRNYKIVENKAPAGVKKIDPIIITKEEIAQELGNDATGKLVYSLTAENNAEDFGNLMFFKKDEKGDGLAGAIFEIQRSNGTAEKAGKKPDPLNDADWGGALPQGVPAQKTSSTKNDDPHVMDPGGVVFWANLPIDYYRIVEVKAPVVNGVQYNLITEPIFVDKEEFRAHGQVQFVGDYATYQLPDVINLPAPRLPKTGGPGQAIFYFTGTLVSLGALAFWARQRRRMQRGGA